MPASPPQPLAIPFRATAHCVYLENKGTSEMVQKIGEANSQSAFHYFVVTYKCA